MSGVDAGTGMADQGGEGLLSGWLRTFRLNQARSFLRGRVLDVGCGSGSLAAWVDPDQYLGMDPDDVSLAISRQRFPAHMFQTGWPDDSESFDTIVALAVIEHVESVPCFLSCLAARLTPGQGGRVILSTPNPWFEWMHHIGAYLGLFSRHARDEHKGLLGRKALLEKARQAGLTLVDFHYFLGGANQLAVFRAEDPLA